MRERRKRKGTQYKARLRPQVASIPPRARSLVAGLDLEFIRPGHYGLVRVRVIASAGESGPQRGDIVNVSRSAFLAGMF